MLISFRHESFCGFYEALYTERMAAAITGKGGETDMFYWKGAGVGPLVLKIARVKSVDRSKVIKCHAFVPSS